MRMHHRLPGRLAAAHADVEPPDSLIVCENLSAQQRKQRLDIAFLVIRQGEVVADMAFADHQKMPRSHRILIADREYRSVFGNQAVSGVTLAKEAFSGR